MLVLLWLVLISMITGADVVDATVSPQQIGAERTRVEKNTSLSDEQKKAALASLDEASAALEQLQQLDERIKRLQDKIDTLPDALDQLATSSNQIDSLSTDIDDFSLEELSRLLEKASQKLLQAKEERDKGEQELADYINVARSGEKLLSEIKKQLDTVREELKKSGEASPDKYQKMALEARASLLQKRIHWFTLRQNNLPQLTALAQSARDHYAEQARLWQQRVDALIEALQKKRQLKAQTAAKDATSAIDDNRLPALQSLQEKIAALATEKSRVVNDQTEVEQKLQQIHSVLDQLQLDNERIQHIVGIAGEQKQVSAMLQKRRGLAPKLADIDNSLQTYQKELNQAIFRQLELDEDLRSLGTLQQQTDAILGKIVSAGIKNPDEIKATKKRVQEVVGNYRKTLLDLSTGYTKYVTQLSSMETLSKRLKELTKSYQGFIDDHLLWMPSASIGDLLHVEYLWQGLAWYIGADNLRQLKSDMLAAWKFWGFKAWLMVGLIVFLLFSRGHALTNLKLVASMPQKIRVNQFYATFMAIVDSLILALPLPLIIWGVGVLLAGYSAEHPYSQAVGSGLVETAKLILLFAIVRQICCPEGLAIKHLRWHVSLCQSLYRELTWSMPLIGISYFFLASTAVRIDDPVLMTLGRVAYLFMMSILLVLIYRIWNRKSLFMESLRQSPRENRWLQYHFIWFFLILAVPVLLMATVLYGYHYSAMYLLQIIERTLWFVLAMLIVKDLLLRSLRVVQRRARLDEVLERRREQMQNLVQQGENAEGFDDELFPEDEIDYGELSEQVMHVVRVTYAVGLIIGCWFIWKEVVPALTVLNNIALPINTTALVDGVSQSVPLTAGEVFFGMLIAVLTFFAAKNLPSVLELSLLQRLPLARSSRYAISSLVQYLVAIVGIFLTFNALGLEWSSVQWLVAALSVGLGFGLQEIVANFVSGIILLFEQPIRVGDVVTVNNVTGKVSKMRIRATTIVDWDRKELIIPNKNFITGELVNWTLSDTINRIVITIGVAYGTNIPKAMTLMREEAADNPKVLDEPQPRVSFEEFGDSALILRLRVYLNDVDQRLSTLTELHEAINARFEQEGIVIAFPQQEIHLGNNPIELVLRNKPASDPGANVNPAN